jgi:hypothetical protein
MIARFGLATLALGAVLAFSAVPARADISLEGAAVVTNNTVSGGAALSLGVLSVPLAPLSGELTVAVPFNGGYAATADARLRFAATSFGAGAGFGTLGATNRTGFLYNAFLGQGIAPHTALEARVYFGDARPATVFAGVRFSI